MTSPSHLRAARRAIGPVAWVGSVGPVAPAVLVVAALLSVFSVVAARPATAGVTPEAPGAPAQPPPGPSDEAMPAELGDLRAEIERLRVEIGSDDFQSFDRYEEPEYARALTRLWKLVGRATAAFLDTHSSATAAEIAAEVATFGALGAPHPWLEASAVRLGGAVDPIVVAVDAGFAGGTFFVVAPRADHRFAAAWDIRPLAERNLAQRNELGRWAYDVPGYHDGPLGGRVLALPPTRSGRPRFLIDAIAHSSMGLEVPGQVSVWEWTGSEAVPELIADYQTTYDVQDVRLEGNLVRIATKEETRTFYTCGSCDDPRGTWTLQLTRTGVIDLGHVFEEPLLGLADDLLHRIAVGEDASALASPEVIARLTELRDSEGEDEGEDEAEATDHARHAFMGMLMSSQVSGAPARRVLDLATDNWHFVFTVVKRAGADYVVALEFPEDAGEV